MTVSIITSVYNNKETIADAINSVLSQTYNNIEYITIDGGSTDGTLDIIKKIKYNSLKIISEPDEGIYYGLNKGLAMATGDVVGFLHSDDLLASNNIISQIVSMFQLHSVDGVYGDLEYVNKKDPYHVIRNWKSETFYPQLLKKGWMPAHPTLFLKNDVYKKHGVFDIKYKIAADYDLMLRVLKDTSLHFEYLPLVITKMRMGGASNRSLKNIIQKTKEDYRAIRSNKAGNLISIIRKNTSKIKQFL